MVPIHLRDADHLVAVGVDVQVHVVLLTWHSSSAVRSIGGCESRALAGIVTAPPIMPPSPEARNPPRIVQSDPHVPLEWAAHGQVARLSDFWVEFGQSTPENWQSEFLQLFSFVVVSAVLIHHGSSESRDGTERIERPVEENPHDSGGRRPPPADDPLTALRDSSPTVPVSGRTCSMSG